MFNGEDVTIRDADPALQKAMFAPARPIFDKTWGAKLSNFIPEEDPRRKACHLACEYLVWITNLTRLVDALLSNFYFWIS